MYGAGAPIIAESSGAFAAGCFPDTQVVESPGPKITLEAQRSMDYSQDAQDPAAFMRGATDLCLKRPRDSASPARSFWCEPGRPQKRTQEPLHEPFHEPLQMPFPMRLPHLRLFQNQKTTRSMPSHPLPRHGIVAPPCPVVE